MKTRNNTLLLTGLIAAGLVFGLSFYGFGVQTPSQMPSEDVQTPSDMAKIGHRNVGSLMSSVTGAEVDKSELVKEALSNLFDELATHFEEKNVPDHVVEKFEQRAESLETMYDSGWINSEQLGSETTHIVRSAARQGSEEGIPVSVFERAGLNEDDLRELAAEEDNPQQSGEAVKRMAQGNRGSDASSNNLPEQAGQASEDSGSRPAAAREASNSENEGSSSPSSSSRGSQHSSERTSGGPEHNEETGNQTSVGSGEANAEENDQEVTKGKGVANSADGKPDDGNPGRTEEINQESEDSSSSPGRVNPGRPSDETDSQNSGVEDEDEDDEDDSPPGKAKGRS